MVRGHFNIYPAEPDTSLPNAGAPLWWEMEVDTAGLFERMRDAMDGDGFVQVNHGRSPGMFSLSGYDPGQMEASSPDVYDETFDAMEVLNGSSYGDAELLRDDWCSHLDRGLRPIAVGVSDVHGRRPGPGYARTYVGAGADGPEDLDLDSFFEGLRAGRAVISGGPFVTLEATSESDGPVTLGDTLVGSTVTLSVRVTGPSWMGIDEVRVMGEGCQVVETFAVDPGEAEAPELFAVETTLYPATDTYYFVEVFGSSSMGYVWPGAHAYALTNPVYVDVP